VIDAGTKALGREPIDAARAPGADEAMTAGFGALLDRPEVTVMRMSEEHGILDLSRTDWQPQVGEQVRIVPNHVCIVVHLFDRVVGVRGGRVERAWDVAARGR
jgi:D-serine deaminase-like pyridoxal phosphate-dependent protein